MSSLYSQTNYVPFGATTKAERRSQNGRTSRLIAIAVAVAICIAQLGRAPGAASAARPVQQTHADGDTVIEIGPNGLAPATASVAQGAAVVWRNLTGVPLTLLEGTRVPLYLPLVTASTAAPRATTAATRAPASPSLQAGDFGHVVPAHGQLRLTFDTPGTHHYFVAELPNGAGVLNVLSSSVKLLQVTPDTDPGSGYQAIIEPIADPHSQRDAVVNFAFDLRNISGQNLAIRGLHFTYMDAANNVLQEQSVSPDQMVDLLMSLNVSGNPNPDNWSFAGKAALVDKTWDDFYAGWHSLEGQGWRMTDIEIHVEDGKRLYSGLFAPGTHTPAALVGLEWNAFLIGWQDLEAQGYRISDIESYVDGNKRFYAGLFKPADYAKAALVNMEWTPFLKAWQDLEAQGLRMIDIEAHDSGGKVVYTGLFQPGTYAPAALVGKEWNDFFAGWQDLEDQGYRIFDLETYQAGGRTLYAGLFKPATYAKAALVDQTWDDFFQNWKNLDYLGLRMIDFETRSKDGKRLYTGIFAPGPALNWFAGKRLFLLSPEANFESKWPAKVKISMQFDNWAQPWSFVLPLKAYVNQNSTHSFAFPALQSDLGRNEYWFMGSHGGHEGPKPWLGPDASERGSDAHRGALWDSLNEGNVAFSQQYAYDLGVVKWNGSQWAACDPALGSVKGRTCTENEDFYVWGTPVYAMDDGVVLYCFRSAPNNPAPGKSASVPGQPGGGNMYWIQHTGGEIALYAHLKAGSVSVDACPTEGFQSAPYPVIHKGQQLGLAGNSGSSSGPHLHIHVQATWQPGDKGEGVPLLFNNVSVSKRANTTSLTWQSAGQEAVAADDSNVAQSAESDTLIKINR